MASPLSVSSQFTPGNNASIPGKPSIHCSRQQGQEQGERKQSPQQRRGPQRFNPAAKEFKTGDRKYIPFHPSSAKPAIGPEMKELQKPESEKGSESSEDFYSYASSMRIPKPRRILMQHGVCFKFFETGECDAGVQCKFSHVLPGTEGNLISTENKIGPNGEKKEYYRPPTRTTFTPQSQDVICFTWARKGWCIHGDKCWNQHIQPGDELKVKYGMPTLFSSGANKSKSSETKSNITDGVNLQVPAPLTVKPSAENLDISRLNKAPQQDKPVYCSNCKECVKKAVSAAGATVPSAAGGEILESCSAILKANGQDTAILKAKEQDKNIDRPKRSYANALKGIVTEEMIVRRESVATVSSESSDGSDGGVKLDIDFAQKLTVNQKKPVDNQKYAVTPALPKFNAGPKANYKPVVEFDFSAIFRPDFKRPEYKPHNCGGK